MAISHKDLLDHLNGLAKEKTTIQDLINTAAAKVFGEGVSPPIHPGDIKWSWHRVNPDETVVREVPGSEYARAEAHVWTAYGDVCTRCGIARELVEDYTLRCGDPVAVRDALIDLMLKRNAKQAGELIQRRSVEQDRDADLAKALQRMTENYELSCVARDQLRSRVRILEEDNARLKTELDRHPWARRMV